MKKGLKVVLFITALIFICCLAIVLIFFASFQNYKFDSNNIINPQSKIIFYDCDNKIIDEQSKGISVTEIKDIPIHTQKAFISIEDKRFYKHKGVDYRALLRATINNIKSFSFKEGGSTISQQLIKNTHLTNEKTFKRKFAEIKLAKELEKKYSKDKILETYLNTIYFGENCYGITSASHYYFNKTPSELNVNESAMLAAIVKAPSYYSPFVNSEKAHTRKNLVLKEMLMQNYLTNLEYQKLINETGV